ncbi:LysR family transcriptional regulator [Pseudomonas sp. CCC3.1]|uniref:LysR family transcriptional regulator n=1 Tax=Pseudomonas sp. CCC3.1 TaxID=3048607 RepID=UPI002AC9960A|nr:LysR family transcriptional regulator [Pseudomonas sp. CCC3.1]MEB0206888.1 LysR family transcriptional regulator [Pseudomonas sp. CCC3.1]WPX34408.1 LysR family transcriptional regulator [Pseudomonas sp. CCC3.1]
MDFDPALLRALIAIKETGSFTRAAERMHVSQSAISHQIRRLEEQAGTTLLTRTTRRLTLTEDGEDFLRHAECIIKAHDALIRRFETSSVTGAVRFGLPENFIGDGLPPLLTRFTRQFPAVRLDVTVCPYLDLRAQVDTDKLDLAVVLALPGSPAGGTVLRETHFVWVAAQHFEFPDAGLLPLAFAPAPCVHRQVAIDALQDSSVEWRVAFTSASQQGLRAAVLAGLAVTALPKGDLEPGMRVIDGQYGLPALPKADFRLIWSIAVKNPAACAFGKLLVSVCEPN